MKRGGELLRVAGVAILISALSSWAIAARRVAPGDPLAELLPHQRLFRSLSENDQRMIREMSEGLLEIENGRSSSGHWPSVHALAEEGIPPFAPNPIEPRRFQWQAANDARGASYVGLQKDMGGKAFLILVIDSGEPRLGQPGAPRLDETHHFLGDGRPIHVSVWERDDTRAVPNLVIANPALSGWVQILGRAPEPR